MFLLLLLLKTVITLYYKCFSGICNIANILILKSEIRNKYLLVLEMQVNLLQILLLLF